MNHKKWTAGLMALGAISLASVAKAEEKMNFVQTAISGTTISGYVDTSIEWAVCPDGRTFGVYGLGGAAGVSHYGPFGSSSRLTIPFREGKQDGFNLNVVQLNINKALDETPWASGYNVSLLYGPDAVGWNPSANGNSSSDFAIKNANVVLRAPVGNGLDIKIGVFDTIIGYEVFEAGSNGNFSRSWGYAIEPTQHTGVLLTYHFNDNISVSAGVANTLHTGINTRDTSEGTRSYWDKTGLFSITLVAPQSWGWLAGATASGGAVIGFNGASSDAMNLYLGLTIPLPVKGLSIGASFDYLSYCADYKNYDPSEDDCYCVSMEQAVSSSPYHYNGQDNAEVYGAALYVSWQATEKLSAHLRGEYIHGDYNDDSTIFYDSFDSEPLYTYKSHYETDVFSVTATLQYNIWQNVISRIEARYDQACYDPYDYGADNDDQFSIYLNIIYKF